MENILDCFPEQITVYAVWSSNAIMIDDELLDIVPSQKIYDHSREFAWGYGGSGPAQFALALLLKYIPAEQALKYYQLFKELVIVHLPNATFYRTIRIREQMARVLAREEGIIQQELF